MARTSVRDSATSQFFINVKDNDFLNYTGESPQGPRLRGLRQGRRRQGSRRQDQEGPDGNTGGHQNVPTTPVVIEKAECI
jgi:cyclophilin family peptidyl-prolyl cis-trans isomerase